MTFSSGIITGAVAMLPVVAWLGWRLSRARFQLRCADANVEWMIKVLAVRREYYAEKDELITLGRTRRASYDADNARRKASRAKKREAGE